jgi:hypothetical protein
VAELLEVLAQVGLEYAQPLEPQATVEVPGTALDGALGQRVAPALGAAGRG